MSAGDAPSSNWATYADAAAVTGSLDALAGVNPADLSGAELVDAIVVSEKALSLLAATQMRLLAALAVPFVAGDPMRLAARLARKNCSTSDDSPEQVEALVPDAAISLASAEVAAALRISPVTAGIRIREAGAMTTVLAPTLSALESGQLDRGKARIIAEHCDPLSPENQVAVQDLVLPRASQLTPGELRDITGQAVITVDPDGCDARHQAAAARRDLAMRALPDAMATLKAFLPADAAVKIFQISDLLATATSGAKGDDRGIGARRVDALADIADQLLTHGHLDLSYYLGNPLPDHGFPHEPCSAGKTSCTSDGAADESDLTPTPPAAGGCSHHPASAHHNDTIPAIPAPAGIDHNEATHSTPTPTAAEGARATGSSPHETASATPSPAATDLDLAAAPVLSIRDHRHAAPTSCADGPGIADSGDNPAAGIAADLDMRASSTAADGNPGNSDSNSSANSAAHESVSMTGPPAPTTPIPGPDRPCPACGSIQRSERTLTRQGRRPHLSVTLGLGTLAGLDDLPGKLAGFGAITPSLARSIAASAGTIGALLADHETGSITEAGALIYRPRQDLRDQIALLYGTCQFPSCRQPVWRCDIDHREPFDHDHPDRGGQTTTENTGPYCRRHHLFKHHTEWRTRPDSNSSTLIWISPTGHSYGKETVQTMPPNMWVSTAATLVADRLDTITAMASLANDTAGTDSSSEELLAALLLRHELNRPPAEYDPAPNARQADEAGSATTQSDARHDEIWPSLEVPPPF